MKPNVVIVLEALCMGIDVEIEGAKFRLRDGKIFQVGKNESGEECLLNVFLTINDFMTLTSKLTEKQVVSLTGALCANKMSKKRR